MNDDDIELLLERKAIEVEHWEPDVAQAAFEHYKAEVERRKEEGK